MLTSILAIFQVPRTIDASHSSHRSSLCSNDEIPMRCSVNLQTRIHKSNWNTYNSHTHTHARIHSYSCSCRSACFEGPLRMNEKVLQTRYDATRHTIMLGPASFVASSCCVSLVFHMNQLPVIHIGALNLCLLFQ